MLHNQNYRTLKIHEQFFLNLYWKLAKIMKKNITYLKVNNSLLLKIQYFEKSQDRIFHLMLFNEFLVKIFFCHSMVWQFFWLTNVTLRYGFLSFYMLVVFCRRSLSKLLSSNCLTIKSIFKAQNPQNFWIKVIKLVSQKICQITKWQFLWALMLFMTYARLITYFGNFVFCILVI